MWAINLNAGRNIVAGAFPAFQPKSKKRRSPLQGSIAQVGAMEVRLAATRKEIRKAQRLRFKVFFGEGGAVADAKTKLTRRDADRFDKFCDHLIVIDHSTRNRFGKIKPKVVGAYRLLRSDVALEKNCGFYSADEYEVASLLERHPHKRFLELGRSCVLADYRGKRTIDLLWRGILAYIRHYDIDALIGCASFEGANAFTHAAQLSFLAYHARAEGEWQVRARESRRTPMEMLGREAVDERRALAALPPLIKGYLRIGARFGDGAVVDRKFNTVDVFVVMPVEKMDARYLEHFGGHAEKARQAA
ncbi:GNAT family N-acetyltransferase [Methylocystis heyeri]|uniref:L-ornithine N(alpha)-acyltransferase n=1 Tax=Methylocystis heyeri TaxID=391905 RepID=A0A6B8KCL2_9HYPH|nr:GNAT family N-acyltransferase [Methylocystis heyeri]QGM45342.1 GNAT family N-acetyltransferase [Methylocystis heyeri]